MVVTDLVYLMVPEYRGSVTASLPIRLMLDEPAAELVPFLMGVLPLARAGAANAQNAHTALTKKRFMNLQSKGLV